MSKELHKTWHETELDIMHLYNVANLYHDSYHGKNVPAFEDCHAYTCRRAREAVARLTGLTTEQVGWLRDKTAGIPSQFDNDPPYKPMKVMS